MVVKTDLEKLKIDVVDELHKVRRKHLNTCLLYTSDAADE